MSIDPAALETKKVRYGLVNGEPRYLTVRGLTATDFAALINEQEQLMLMLFGGNFNWSDANTTGKELLIRAPALAALAIALAVDEPGEAEFISKLPLPVQIELFSAVYHLTMPDGLEETTKKLQEQLKPLFKSKKG